MVRLPKEQSSELHSPQSLANAVSRIEQLLVAARRVAAEMERLKTGDISIANRPSFKCAMGDLSRWGNACEDALTERLIEMGHFRTEATRTPGHARQRPSSAPKTGKAEESEKILVIRPHDA